MLGRPSVAQCVRERLRLPSYRLTGIGGLPDPRSACDEVRDRQWYFLNENFPGNFCDNVFDEFVRDRFQLARMWTGNEGDNAARTSSIVICCGHGK